MPRGSHTTWGAYDSRVCIICGQPIRITVDAGAWMHHDDITGEHRSAHTRCGTPLRRRDTMNETPTTEPETEPDTGEEGGDEEADGDTDAG